MQLDRHCHRPKGGPGSGRRVRSVKEGWMPSPTWIPPQGHAFRPSGRKGRLFFPLLCLSCSLCCHAELLPDGQSQGHRAALQMLLRGHRGGGQSQRVNRWAHPMAPCYSHPAQVIHRWQNSQCSQGKPFWSVWCAFAYWDCKALQPTPLNTFRSESCSHKAVFQQLFNTSYASKT